MNYRINIRNVTEAPTGTLPYDVWYVLHDIQMGFVRDMVEQAEGVPEVNRLEPYHFSDFPRAWQLLEYSLNEGMTPNKWTALHRYDKAFNNNQGFQRDGDPRANFVTGDNLTAELPKQATLICGGNILRGVVQDEDLLVDTLDPRNPPPSKAWVLMNRWSYQFALNVKRDGTISRFPQNDGRDVIVLNLATRRMTYPLNKLRLIRAGTVLPSPYAI